MIKRSIFHQFRKSVYSNPCKILFEDILGQKIQAGVLLFKSLFLGLVLREELKKNKSVGLCLPNTNTFPLVFLALISRGYIPAILNYKSGTTNMKNAVYIAGVRIIITSRLFEEKAFLFDTHNSLKETGIHFIYLEDILNKLNFFEKGVCIFRIFFTRVHRPRENDPAVVLFTSGSEGTPKGVVLSHKNLVENVRQVSTRMNLTSDDIFFSSLPFFHSFGLVAGLLVPMFCSLKSYIYTNPLDYKTIPQKIEESKATIFFSANTFLQGYAMSAQPKMLKGLRAIYAGAEKLCDQTRILYKEKFGVNVYEGYGVTETSPVVSVNVDGLCEIGSVGKPLDDIEVKIEPVDGCKEGGRLFIKGPNVMLGYYLISEPQKLIRPKGGWHDTGDIAFCDENGFIFILGRVKRFAKIGGEMISLGAVEYCISQNNPDYQHAAIAIKDSVTGERIILFTTCKDLTQDMVVENLKEHGFSKLYNPKFIVYQESLPLLSTGKLDYVSIQKILENIQLESPDQNT